MSTATFRLPEAASLVPATSGHVWPIRRCRCGNYEGFSPPGNRGGLPGLLVELRGFEPMAIAHSTGSRSRQSSSLAVWALAITNRQSFPLPPSSSIHMVDDTSSGDEFRARILITVWDDPATTQMAEERDPQKAALSAMNTTEIFAPNLNGPSRRASHVET